MRVFSRGFKLDRLAAEFIVTKTIDPAGQRPCGRVHLRLGDIHAVRPAGHRVGFDKSRDQHLAANDLAVLHDQPQQARLVVLVVEGLIVGDIKISVRADVDAQRSGLAGLGVGRIGENFLDDIVFA